jgi:hypothetical protein
MIIFLLIFMLGVAFVAATVFLVHGLTPAARRKPMLLWLTRWAAKGIVTPLAIWVLMNVGLTWWLQPFMPQIQEAIEAGTSRVQPFLLVTGYGVFVVTSFWMAATLGWVLAGFSRELKGEERSHLKSVCLGCGIVLALPALVFLLLGGWPLAGFAVSLMLIPIAAYAPNLPSNARKAPPMYAKAIARLKFGKYAEAEMEIIHQLEKYEDDVEGWLMLAELYASQFDDLPEAERTVLELCENPQTNPSQLSIALHKLADWHLRLGHDPAAAQKTLQRICHKLPGTHLAHMAQLRINQLPKNAEEMTQHAKPIALPHAESPQRHAPVLPEAVPHEVSNTAGACLAALRQDPNDVATREKLAELFAGPLGQPGRGVQQLLTLCELAGQPEPKRAGWLALAAAWQLELMQDIEAGRASLERLIQEHPESAQAASASERLRALQSEKITPKIRIVHRVKPG